MGRQRKVRSDKKVDCKPTVPVELKECIYRISYVTNTPVKDIAEIICVSGLKSKKVIGLLSDYLRRDLQIGNTFYIGDLDRESLQKMKNTKTERITTRFNQNDFESIRALAYSLDVTPTRAAAILLDKTIHHTNIVNRLAKEYVSGHLNESKMKELKKIIYYINRNGSSSEKISWVNLLSYFYDELKDGSVSMSKTISNWIENINQKMS